jgi:hypothetical protein
VGRVCGIRFTFHRVSRERRRGVCEMK